MARNAIDLGMLTLDLSQDARAEGARVLDALLRMADAAMTRLASASNGRPLAALSRLRGTGRGVSSSALLHALDRDFPIHLASPFEGSNLVSGAVWESSQILGSGDSAVAKLHWAAGADDLPMHVHDHADRFIIVLSGRGYFHVSDQPVDNFDGLDVRTIPARERDVFCFSRGVVHTFSTTDSPMTLLSCQLPHLPFDHPDQYRLPTMRWVARDNTEPRPTKVSCDTAWMLLISPVGL